MYPLPHYLDNRITSNIIKLCIVRSGNITVVIPTGSLLGGSGWEKEEEEQEQLK